MNSIDIANGIIFQKMAISVENFDDRLLCQKKVYLLQSLGTNLGYAYHWYVRGPYSPDLTNYIYTNLDVLTSCDFSKYKLRKSAEENIESINGLLDERKQDLGVPSWYELLASLLYIYNNKESWKIGNQKDSDILFSTLIKYKPQYNANQCAYAFKVLEENGFIEERS